MSKTIHFNYPEKSVLEHPSDVGLEVHGETLGKALENLIVDFYSLQLKSAKVLAEKGRDLTICAMDYESLVVRILSELLYLLQGERKLWMGNLTVKENEGEVCAQGNGIEMDVEVGPQDVIEDIKAVTYHRILVEKNNDWRIRVFFDI